MGRGRGSQGGAARASGLQRDRRVIAAIWIAVLSVCAFLPGAFNRWVLPKELLLLAAVVLACLVLPRGRLPRAFWLIIGAGTLVLAVSAALSANPLVAFFGRYPRYEGLVSLPVYVAAAWLGARVLGPTARADERRAFGFAAAAASALIGLVSVLEAVGLTPIATDLERPGSLLGNASDQGIVAAVLVALVLPALGGAYLRRDRTALALLGGGVLAGIVTVALSASRAGVLALAAGLVVVVVVGVVRAPVGRRRMLALGALALSTVIAAAVLAVPFTRSRLLGADDLAAQTIDDRFAIWGRTIELWAQHPLLGVGPSGFLTAFMRGQDAAWQEHLRAGGTLDSPHNAALQALVGGGVLGVLAAVALLVLVGIAAWRSLRGTVRTEVVGAVAGLVALGAGLATHFTSAATGILGGLCVGIVLAGAARSEAVWHRRLRTAGATVWLVLLAVVLWGEVQLGAGASASTAADADRAFAATAAVRPWDADAVSIAAQVLTARADGGDMSAVESAQTWSRRAVALLPDDRTALVAAGVAERRAGELDDSRTVLERALELYPNDPLVLAQTGVARLVQRDTSGLELLEQAGRVAPDDETVQGLLTWGRSLLR